MSRRCAAIALFLVAVSGCGGTARAPRLGTATTSTRLPALATSPTLPREVVVRGEGSPGSFGPYAFKGRYLVRFEQYAPENAALDFAGQTPLTAALERQAGVSQGAVALFGAARPTGSRVLTIDGSYIVDVSFGDYPFVIRFTPRAG